MDVMDHNEWLLGLLQDPTSQGNNLLACCFVSGSGVTFNPEAWCGAPLWGVSAPAILTKISMVALLRWGDSWQGKASKQDILVTLSSLWLSGYRVCLDHTNRSAFVSNWISSATGCLNQNQIKIIIQGSRSLSVFLFFELVLGTFHGPLAIRKGYLTASVPVFINGVGGPSAPHVFESCRREELGRALTRSCVLILEVLHGYRNVPLSFSTC